ncbi:hypothetical protein J4460_03455 [Candidatus Woesearchaeota archaeon]|nr:MAG: hypothetical protein QS99_C0008G0061 [archaeon GW2011_AR4]MBS3129705.1 hypothetical protein [Candidatus Woesearchaeota archaeon]HIH38809.1 hypothetical protein [Candidatus Woesearchaeota archaeon]HIH49224.1 hypothetical protein [Candidatus Woesearchaeota archaeon]HIJ03367.1 hypothetical protein [Candidatus Woesearchaeota archaeon]
MIVVSPAQLRERIEQGLKARNWRTGYYNCHAEDKTVSLSSLAEKLYDAVTEALTSYDIVFRDSQIKGDYPDTRALSIVQQDSVWLM